MELKYSAKLTEKDKIITDLNKVIAQNQKII